MSRLTVEAISDLRIRDFRLAIMDLGELDTIDLRDLLRCKIAEIDSHRTLRARRNPDDTWMSPEEFEVWKLRTGHARSYLVAMHTLCKSRIARIKATPAPHASPNGGLMGMIAALLEVAERHEPRDASEAMLLQRARHTVGRSRQAVGA